MAFLSATKHTSQAVQQRRFTRAGRAQQQYPLAGLDGQVQIAEGPTLLTGVLPTPLSRCDFGSARSLRHCAATVRPEANRLSAPVLASPRTTNHDSTPAISAPDTTAEAV